VRRPEHHPSELVCPERAWVEIDSNALVSSEGLGKGNLEGKRSVWIMVCRGYFG